MSYAEYWKLWADINGVKLVVQVGKEFDSGEAPDWLAREMYESKLYVSKYGWAGGDPNVKKPEEVGVEMDKLMDIERYMREYPMSDLLSVYISFVSPARKGCQPMKTPTSAEHHLF
ncbi:hypothetical protein ASPVEDRAFT_32978 [Aspergillus versicolor CBS 583.65]|uniref:Uncharacterized protein n=1 Tax=Aspergillus versicolor CBS 583.65 TaxID=1036611 RepID=A0A1L9PYS6_ASPVE|nr:uncharacterized protein ASPVEDRAFT_32978 [Aspergillus versicolor CBS 583.65]OJJ06700.1 hypothetical protein ASPVEDRAFT_32978 [Aspergillus versicolor CBS 583.65]